MLNNSKRLLLSNSNSNDWAINDNKSNGKAKCYICLQESIEFSDDDSDSNIYKEDKVKLSKIVQGDKSYMNIKFENSLIAPCICDIIGHPTCIRKHIILNLSIKCKKCNTYYNLDYEYKKHKLSIHIKYLIYIILLTIFHISLFIIAFAILLEYFEFSEKNYYLKYMIFTIIITFNIFLIILSIKLINYSLNFKEININVLPYTKLHSEKIFTFNDLDKFSKFLGYRYNISKIDLFEKKMSIKYYSYINKNKKRLSQFIKENNSNCYIYNTIKEKNIKLTNSDISQNISNKISQLGMVDEIKNINKRADLLYTINEKDSLNFDYADKNLPFEKILQLRINKRMLSGKKNSDSIIE